MEVLRESIKIQEMNKIQKTLTLLQSSIGYPLKDNIEEIFLQQVSPDSFIWIVISNKYELLSGRKLSREEVQNEKIYNYLTYEQLVHECYQALIHFHLVIVDLQFNQRIVKNTIITLQDQQRLLENHKELQFEQPNRLSICYIKHKSLKTPIFDFYSIKYRVSINEQEQKSIYSKGDCQICQFPLIYPQSETLHFSVIGKLKNGGKTYEILSQIEINLSEIFLSFPLTSLTKEKISPCQLTFDFIDEQPDAPFKEKNQMELEFTLSLSTSQRVEFINKLLNEQKQFDQETLIAN